MKKLILALSCSLLLFIGCYNPVKPPVKFIRFDKVLVTNAGHPPEEGAASMGVGIVTDSHMEFKEGKGWKVWYRVEFQDRTSHLYPEEDLTCVQRFDWSDDTELVQPTKK